MWDKSGADRREALFGGKAAVYVWDALPTPLEPFSAVLACELDPGGSVGRHSQQRDPELVLCVEGTGTATVGAERHALSPGVAVPVAFGETLALENASTERPLRYFIVKAQLASSHERHSLLL